MKKSPPFEFSNSAVNFIFGVTLIYSLLFCCAIHAKDRSSGTKGIRSYSKNNSYLKQSRKLSFIENKGQVRDQFLRPRTDIDFALRASGGLNIFIGKGKMHYQFSKMAHPENAVLPYSPGGEYQQESEQPVEMSMYRMDVELVGANKNAELITEEKQTYYENHFTTNSLPAYSYNKVIYKNIYPNIDWVLYTKEGQLKHEFVLHAGGRVSDIQIKYGGVTSLKLDNMGAIIAETPQGTITEPAPYTYQKDGHMVESSFKLDGNVLSYKTSNYQGELIIDPAILWATYYGGTEREVPVGSAIDADKNLFVCGITASTSGIATTGAYDVTYSGDILDGFILKIDSTGTPLWATYYGGEGIDVANGITFDDSGYLYAVGRTTSKTGIVTSGSFKDTFTIGTLSSSFEGFLVKFTSSGSRVWGTYYGGGGTNGTGIEEVVTDHFGNVYFAGFSSGGDTGIATPGAHDVVNENNNNILVKFRGTGERVWGTFYGGNLENLGSICVDDSSNVYMAGRTQQLVNGSTLLSTPGAHKTQFTLGPVGAADGYLVKFDSTGVRKWGTYFGGYREDAASSLGIDNAGNLYVCGQTWSGQGIATAGAHDVTKDTTGNIYDGFLMKFNNSGRRLWGTYYGANPTHDRFFSLSVVGFDGVYVAGQTTSTTEIATADAYQPLLAGAEDAMLVHFDSSGARVWGTYFGGDTTEVIPRVITDGNGSIYLYGATLSTTGIATPGAFSTSTSGAAYDLFIARFADSTVPTDCTTTGTTSFCIGSTTILTAATLGGLWSSGTTAVATVNTVGLVTGVTPGTAAITYTIGGSCSSIKEVTVNPTLTSNIIGAAFVCVASTTTFIHAISGGSWTSSNVLIATVNPTSGLITGISPGSATITYTVGGCIKTKGITVSAPGSGSISGVTTMCVGGTTVLSYPTLGTSWTSLNTAVATVGVTSGVVTGVSAGTSEISYLGVGGCGSIITVTVLALPTPISGTLSFCKLTTTTLSSMGTTGGTWASSTTSKATVGSASGIVTGVNAGTARITYTWTNACKRTAVVTVNPLPVAGAIVGAGIVHVGSSTFLSPSSPGGTWASATPAIATVTPASGSTCTLTGVSAGTVVISYTNTNGCGNATVNRIFSIVFPRPGGQGVGAEDSDIFSIFPNPTTGVVNILAPIAGAFSVYTIDGRFVQEYQVQELSTTINLPNTLASGIYVGRFNGEDGSTVMVRLVYER